MVRIALFSIVRGNPTASLSTRTRIFMSWCAAIFLLPSVSSGGVISFNLTDATVDELATDTVAVAPVTLTVAAVGNNALLDTAPTGIGVNSDDDSGGAGAQRRIDGTLATPEALHISFDANVTIDSITLGTFGAVSGNPAIETLRLSFVSGIDPIAGLYGYSGQYTVAGSVLSYASPGSQAVQTVTFGTEGQGKINVSPGTVLALTFNPVVETGAVISNVTVTYVPEPSSLALGSIALLAPISRRKRGPKQRRCCDDVHNLRCEGGTVR